MSEDTETSIDAPRIETGLEALSDNIGGLDFTKDEKRRLISMILAGQFYTRLIIQDADYLKTMLKHDMEVQPATIDKIIAHAASIEKFIAGGVSDEERPRTPALE